MAKTLKQKQQEAYIRSIRGDIANLSRVIESMIDYMKGSEYIDHYLDSLCDYMNYLNGKIKELSYCQVDIDELFNGWVMPEGALDYIKYKKEQEISSREQRI